MTTIVPGVIATNPGTAAPLDVGTSAGTVAAGNDARISGAAVRLYKRATLK